MNNEKTNVVINNNKLRENWGVSTFNFTRRSVPTLKSNLKNCRPIIVGFFVLQYAEMRKMNLYYNFFASICDSDKYDEIEMDTNSLVLALAEKTMYDWSYTK